MRGKRPSPVGAVLPRVKRADAAASRELDVAEREIARQAVKSLDDILDGPLHKRPRVGTLAERPPAATTAAGALYLAHDTKKLYRNTQGQTRRSWVEVLPGVSGGGGAGVLVGRAYAENLAATVINDQIPLDDTIPQSDEGIEILSLAYAAADAANILRITVHVPFGSTQNNITASLFKDSAAPSAGTAAVASVIEGAQGAGASSCDFVYEVVAGDTNSHDWSVNLGPNPVNGGTVYLNGHGFLLTRIHGGTSRATIIIEEFTP